MITEPNFYKDSKDAIEARKHKSKGGQLPTGKVSSSVNLDLPKPDSLILNNMHKTLSHIEKIFRGAKVGWSTAPRGSS